MSDLIYQSLREPTAAIAYYLGRQLREQFPDRAVLEVDPCGFSLQSYAHAGECQLNVKPETHGQLALNYCGADADEEEPGPEYTVDVSNCWQDVEWQGRRLEVVQVSWPAGYSRENAAFVLAETEQVAREFFLTVCRWASEVRGEVLVFDGGGWAKSKSLYRSIRNATFSNLILAGGLKDEILNDLRHFVGSRDTYQRYKVPWKRGVLLIGPPGNGKTHTVKALIHALGLPCLYVKSFKAQYSTDHACIRSVFNRARKTTPCLLVMEDLDSLIDAGNRSYFLNELDGFESNTGIIVLATTNHPEKLDRSILERPSRFDRKYHFRLPEPEERQAYCRLWNGSLEVDLRLTDPGLQQLVEATEGFTFAYLKELFLSATMAWMAEPGRPMDGVILAQVESLRVQMQSAPEEPLVTEGEDPMDLRSIMRQAMRFRR